LRIRPWQVVGQFEVRHETQLVKRTPERLAVVAVGEGAEEIPHLGHGAGPLPTLAAQELKRVPNVALESRWYALE
jgi:hypothetical protein